MALFQPSISPRSFAHSPVCSSWERLFRIVEVVLSAGLWNFLICVQAQETWSPMAVGSADWNTPGNWTPASVPTTGTAIFDLSNATTVGVSAPATVGSLQFNTGAPVYSFHLTSPAVFEINGTGVINNSLTTTPSFVNDDGSLVFENSSTAANAMIVTNAAGS